VRTVPTFIAGTNAENPRDGIIAPGLKARWYAPFCPTMLTTRSKTIPVCRRRRTARATPDRHRLRKESRTKGFLLNVNATCPRNGTPQPVVRGVARRARGDPGVRGGQETKAAAGMLYLRRETDTVVRPRVLNSASRKR